jgi:hypothetical protein
LQKKNKRAIVAVVYWRDDADEIAKQGGVILGCFGVENVVHEGELGGELHLTVDQIYQTRRW